MILAKETVQNPEFLLIPLGFVVAAAALYFAPFTAMLCVAGFLGTCAGLISYAALSAITSVQTAAVISYAVGALTGIGVLVGFYKALKNSPTHS